MLLLVGLAIASMVAMGFVGQRSMRALGDELAVDAQQRLEALAEAELLGFTSALAASVEVGKLMVENAAQAQAAEAARLLTADTPPPGTAMFSMHVRPGTDDRAANTQVRRLSAMAAFFASSEGTVRRLARRQPVPSSTDLIGARYLSTKQGVTGVWPQAELPAEFDPTAEAWFEAASPPRPLFRDRAAVWGRPQIDPATGRACLMASCPIMDGREWLGVSAISVPIDEMLESYRPPTRWGSNAEVALCVPVPPGMNRIDRARLLIDIARRGAAPDAADQSLAQNGGLIVIARRGYAAGTDRHAETPSVIAADRAVIGDPSAGDDANAGLGALVNAMFQGDEGVLRLADRFVGFARVDEETFFVTSVDAAVMLDDANRASQRIAARTGDHLRTVGAAALALAALAAGVGLVTARSIVKPLLAMRDAVLRLAAGDFDARVDLRTGDEREELASALNAMAPQLADRVRMAGSLRVAEEVQRRLLPARAPDWPGVDIASMCSMCDETGGDAFDFIHQRNADGDERLIAIIADVSGHGVGAAMLMAMARAAWRDAAARGAPPDEIANTVNARLCEDSPDGRFTTAAILSLSRDTSGLRFTSAGHEAVLLYTPETGHIDELRGTDLPLGIDPAWRFHAHTAGPLQPGCLLVLVTDGIRETRGPDRRFFGSEGLHRAIRSAAAEGAAAVARRIVSDATAFRDGSPQTDDLTVVVLRVL